MASKHIDSDRLALVEWGISAQLTAVLVRITWNQRGKNLIFEGRFGRSLMNWGGNRHFAQTFLLTARSHEVQGFPAI